MPKQPVTSFGRGGAGNITDAQAVPVNPEDLETPVLRAPVITTGRGGTGNMVRNVDPAETRALQDVAPIHRSPLIAGHAGRGGAGNVYMPEDGAADSPVDADVPAAANSPAAAGSPAAADNSTLSSGDKKPSGTEKRKSFLARVKEWLFSKKK